jgi:hypothetical protein
MHRIPFRLPPKLPKPNAFGAQGALTPMSVICGGIGVLGLAHVWDGTDRGVMPLAVLLCVWLGLMVAGALHSRGDLSESCVDTPLEYAEPDGALERGWFWAPTTTPATRGTG